MAGENSKILTGLPNLPPDGLPKELWGEFLTIYTAIKNVLQGVSQYTGIDPPDLLEINTMDPTAYLLGANVGRYYPTFTNPVSRGQMVRINPAFGANIAAIADANSMAGQAIGVANQSVASGKCEVITSGLTDAISGMTPGTLYFLSTTAGAVQNLAPVIPGQIVQPIGWALTSNQLLLNISSYAKQL